MKAALLAWALQTAVSPPLPDQPVQSTEAIMQVGTPITFTTVNEVSSSSNQRGDLLELAVAQDVLQSGQVTIPKGSSAVAELIRVEPKGAWGKAGRLEARLLYVRLGNRTIRLSGAIGTKGKSGTAGTVLTALAAGTLGFAVTGTTARLLAGTEVVGYLDREARLPLAGAGDRSTMPD